MMCGAVDVGCWAMSERTALQAALARCLASDVQIARHLKVSTMTVDRWRSGMSQPHAKAIPYFLAALDGVGTLRPAAQKIADGLNEVLDYVNNAAVERASDV